MKFRISKVLLQKSLSCVLAPLVLVVNWPIAALAAPQLPAPTNVPTFAQNPKSVRMGPRKLKPVQVRTLPANPTDLEISTARVFEEPLIPMSGPAQSGENADLSKAIQSFRSTKNVENVSALTAFISTYPKSRWIPSLKLNLGLLRFESGYISQAMQLWKSGWEASKNEKGRAQKAVADRCIAEVLQLNAKVGRMQDIEQILAEIKGRAFEGSIEQKVRGSSDALMQMHSRPEKAFKCGPFAVASLLNIKNGKQSLNRTIDDFPSTKEGTSLQQNKELAEKVGLKLQIAKRATGSPVVVPSILHWKLGHFATVTKKIGDRYQVKDPTFGFDATFLVSPQVFDSETDGYALIPAGSLPAGWKSVSKEEGAKIFGKGVPWLWPDNMGCSRCGKGPSCGMMQFDIRQTSTDIHLFDTPISYSCPIGGTVGFGIEYQYLQANQPSTYTFTNFGPNWSFQYLSYLTLDPSSTATVRLSDAFSEVYVLSGGVYKRDKLSQALLVNMGSGVYQRQMPDGSVQEYSLSDGATPAKIFMTKIIDPQANETLIQYDADFRITTITDPIGEVSTLSYVSNTLGNSGFYKVSQISDPFSRTASFGYDSTNTNLVSTTDVLGLQSKMSYDTGNTFVNALQTVYGTTSFHQYTPTPSAYPTRGVQVHYPDGSDYVLESWIGHEPYNATFIWDREAMERYPNDPINHDFTHCDKIAWLWGPVDGYLWPIIDYLKPPLENRTTYTYPDEGFTVTNRGMVGADTINKPLKITRQAATPIKATIGGTKTTGDVLTLSFTDVALPGGSQSIAYTVQSADTLNTISSALATAVNSNANLKKLGVTAAATGTTIALVSQSSNYTVYSKSTSGGATETIALATSVPQSAQMTVSGPFTGPYIFIFITINGNYSGQAQYNIQPGDTPTTVATGLKNAVNASSLFINQGISANSYGAQLFVSTSTTPDQIILAPATYGSEKVNVDYQISAGNITSSFQYNSLGHPTLSVDPGGRVVSNTYAGNGIDLTQATETQNNDSFMLGNWTYNSQHEPTQYIDGSARTWTYTYNSAGQKTSTTDPNSDTTTLTYTGTSSAFLTQINGPLSGSNDVTTFSYDGFNRLDTTTDSVGYQLSFDYDSADRKTLTTYPDATTEQTVYDRLDAIFSKDRIGRWSQSGYDSLDQLTFELDPLGRKTQYDWCNCGSLTLLTDPAGNVTKWHHDIQGRKVQKVYADQTAINYAYEPGAGRMLTRLDALNQTTNYFLNSDSKTFATGYQNAVNPTSTVINLFDNKFSRISSVQNDWGTISYSYNAYVTGPGSTPTTGGGRLSTVQNNVIANSDITYVYDTVGRTINRSIDGANNSIDWAYDAMSRVTSEQNVLGTFNYTYVDDTPGSSKGVTRLASVAYPNSQVTNYDWYGNTGDQRLKTINNLNPSGGTLSRFDYEYNPAGEILQWQQQQNGGNDFHNFKYDRTGQLTSDQVGSGSPQAPFSKEFHYAYDSAANRVGVQVHSVDTLRVSGTKTTSDVLTVTVNDTSLSGGQQAVNYTVQSGDTLSTIAQGIALAINTNANLQAIGVAANAQSGKTFVNIRAASGNITTYSTSTSGGATEVLSLGIWKNGLENAIIGGSKTTGDVITLTFKDIALSGGTRSVAYTVLSGDTLTTIATNIAAAINADTPLQNLGVNATSVGTTISIASNSVNVTSYSSSLSGGATETVALSVNQNALQTATIAGTKTTGDILTLTVYDSSLGGGLQAVSYTVQSGDSLTSIATGVAAAINGNGNLQAIGVGANSSGTIVTIQSKSTNLTTFRAAASSSATESITLSVPVNAWTVAAIGGTKTTGNVLTITTFDAGLSGGKKSVNYTVQSGDTLTSIATNLTAALNADTDLQSIGVSATSNSTVVSLKSTSANLTTFAQSLSTGATETIALSSSTSVIQSTVNNVNELVALAPGGKARFQGTTSKPVVSANISGQVITISQAALKPVDFTSSVAGVPTETITLSTNLTGNIDATIAGTVTPGDVLSITFNDIRFPAGPVTISYTVKSGDTTTTIATAMKNLMAANQTLIDFAYYNWISSSGPVISIHPFGYYADVIYSKSVTGVPTENVTYSANLNGNTTATIAGSVTTGDVVSLTIESDELSGGQEIVSYTTVGGNTTSDIATGLKNAINANSNLAAIGVTATSSAAVVTVAKAGTTFTTSTSGGATETLTLGTNANGSTTVAVGGKATNGDTVTVVTHNPLLPSGQQSVSYNVGSSDTLVDVAAGLAAAMSINSNLQNLGVTAKNDEAADFHFSQSFAGNGALPAEASLANISATDAVPTTRTNTNSLKVTSSTSSTLTWDANGNMTSDGTNSYKWDAENRLIEIDFPGAGDYSAFAYDGLHRNVLIQEYTSSSLTSTKQFVWSDPRSDNNEIKESRNAVGTITAQYFGYGQTITGSSYPYTRDNILSIREITNAIGTVVGQFSYDPYGRATQLQGSTRSDFQFAGYFSHIPSGLDLAVRRAYNPVLARWISRDPLGEKAGHNLFAYVGNRPVTMRDPSGLQIVPNNPYTDPTVPYIMPTPVCTPTNTHIKPPYNPGESEFKPPPEKPKDWPTKDRVQPDKCHDWCLHRQSEENHSAGWLNDCFKWCEDHPGCWKAW